MGGKRNQANRTKGNARPSSSGRTAEKLATSGNILPNFMGFGGFVIDPLQGSDDQTNVNIDADLRLAMKKMTKKDVTTKLKAIQEFTDSCQSRSPEEIKAILSFWPRLFNKLSMDHDRRVRESLFQAHEQVVLCTRKNLAPFLRNIMGSWIIGQCDIYAPAASAAHNSFKAAFPPAKQPEALAFCKNEIIALIDDNLFQQTARSLSDPETTPVEEMEAKYIRIITSSFSAWKLILNAMPKSEHETLMENYSKMLTEAKFWKFAKHESPLIRSAWFSLISTLCQIVPSILNEKKLCPLVLSSLDDYDALVSPVVWEAAMYTLVTFDNCWNHVNARKAVLPKLWTVLQNGGNGNASIIYPNLLPFLNKIPSEVMGDPIQFYSDFFTRMRKGLSSPNIQLSVTELSSIIKSYVECLKFIASKHMDDEELQIKYLIADQLIPVIQSSLQEKSSKLTSTNLYELFKDLLQYWHNYAENLHKYVLKQFELTCREILEVEDNNYALSQLNELFECLLGKTKQRKSLRVQFSDDIEEYDDKPLLKINLPIYLTGDQHPFFLVLCNVCLYTLQIVRKTNSMPHFKLLASILSCYSNPKLLLYLSDKNEIPNDSSEGGKIFFNDIILPLLSFDSLTDNKEFAENFMNLALSAYNCADNDTKFEILNNLCNSKNPAVTEQLLYKAPVFSTDEIFTKWLKSNTLETTLQELTLQLSTEQTSPNSDVIWRILSFSFSTDLLVSSACLEKILKIFQQVLTRDSVHLEPSLQFVCNLASKLFINCKECWSISSTTELLVTMFSITCQPLHNLSENTLLQVESTWLLGINSFESFNDEFFNGAANVIQNAVLNENVNSKCLINLVETTWKLFECLYHKFNQNENETTKSALEDHFLLFLPSKSTWQRLRQQLGNEWMINAILQDALVFIKPEISEQSSIRTENYSYFAMASFVLEIFVKVFSNDEKNFMKNIPISSIDHLKEILYAIAYCEMNETVETKKNFSEIISILSNEAPTQLNSIINEIESNDKKKLVNDLEDLSRNEGYLWSLTYNKTSKIIPNLFTNERKLFDWSENENQSLFHHNFVNQNCFYHDWKSNPLSVTNSETDFDISKLIRLIALSRKQLHLIDTNDTDVQMFIESVLKLLISWRDEKADLLLFENKIGLKDWSVVTLNIEIFKFISTTIIKFGEFLESNQWDFILCGLCLWLTRCAENENKIFTRINVLFYMNECCKFFKITSDFITNNGVTLHHHPELETEWNEFFSSSLFPILLKLLLSISGMKETNKLSDAENKLIISLTLALEKIPLVCLQNNQLEKVQFDPQIDPQIPENFKILLAHLSPLLTSPIRQIQLSAYQLLKRVINIIVLSTEFQEENENSRQLPSAFKTILTDMTAVVNSYFAETGTTDEPVNIQPESSVFSFVISYLLTWDLVMELLSSVSSELRCEYSEYLHASGLMPDLLANLFNLIPENAVLPNCTQSDGESIPKTMFSVKPSLDLNDKSSAQELKHLSCQVYFAAVKKLPALVRQWWNNQDKQTNTLIERITSKYVSTIIINEELQSILNSERNFGNMNVRARVKTQEVVAVYGVDEISTELLIHLAPNHPLGRVTVECVRRIGVGHTQWRNWMLQLNTFLMYQNGSILDGLNLWKRNIDKKFEGVEECYICFYVLHGSNFQLPRLTCRACKKKFHSECLYKWFSTSNQSTCPLCRNLF